VKPALPAIRPLGLIRSLRLRVTSVAAGLLVLGPALFLWQLPRPQAQGLERLLPQMALLQSLPPAPTRPVPQLWQQRLGLPLARRLWRQQRRIWWQGWGRHGDSGAYLVVPLGRAELLPGAQRPAHSLLLNDLLVVAADPLSLKALQDQLRNVQRPLQGLDRRCLSLLESQQAVFWKPVGLGGLSGELAPLLLGYQEGCLALALDGPQLQFSGEATASPDPVGGPIRGEVVVPSQPLGSDLLLELQGPSLQPLLQGYLSRQLVREALAANYGIGPAQLDLLRQLPFRLQLRAIAAGPFRAGLVLQVQPGRHRQALAALLNELRPRLQQQGLEDAPPQWRAGASASGVLPEASWRRDDGTLVGGWRWQLLPGQQPQLQLFLGPVPSRPPVPVTSSGSALQLSMRPAQMVAAGLLPASLPTVVQQASQLELGASAQKGPLSRLQGRLQLALRSPAR
jgi:hypothetical protein